MDKEQFIQEFNDLHIKDMDKVTELHELEGSYVNLKYTLANQQSFQLWKDDEIVLGNQMHKHHSDRCYGLSANDKYLLVCEYGENGIDPEIVVFKRREVL